MTMITTPLQKPSGNDSFSPLFRLGNRVQYVLLWVLGPARLSHALDPREQLNREYERRRDLDERWRARSGR